MQILTRNFLHLQEKYPKHTDDSSCTTLIFIQSDALHSDNAPPQIIFH